ncbi:hypothetical protein FF38_08624 [Lucilia cuprina]|uniref:Uncharacterized protein n=1 Tax=Lucilia cuprina TaxID=7375 RepID=A0A0L0C2D4_LUCCU|nr:hypothetical protein FF38_08624 [Lucilia cuprina]
MVMTSDVKSTNAAATTNLKNDTKFTTNNVATANFKNTSMSSISTITSKTETSTTLGDPNMGAIKKRLESMTDEEIIQRNLRELMEKKNREERKANGRLVAVILASLVIFLAIYHAWIRNPENKLAGVLVPAVIMLSFGGWVVVLAKRDKARRQMFEKYLEEVAIKNKQELEAKSKSKTKKPHDKKLSNEILLHFENEINKDHLSTATTSILKNNDHRKHRKHRNASNSDGYSTTSSSSSKKSSHYATKDLRVKRPSIRQKLFRQSGIYHMPNTTVNATQTLVQAVINTPVPQCAEPLISAAPPKTLMEKKRKRLQRLDALQVPAMVRMSSAP